MVGDEGRARANRILGVKILGIKDAGCSQAGVTAPHMQELATTHIARSQGRQTQRLQTRHCASSQFPPSSQQSAVHQEALDLGMVILGRATLTESGLGMECMAHNTKSAACMFTLYRAPFVQKGLQRMSLKLW